MTGANAIYKAVAAGKSVDHVRRKIEACAPGAKRVAAVNSVHSSPQQRTDTPLLCARRLGRGDLVRLLVDHGAMVTNLPRGFSPLFFCLAFGSTGGVRTLFRTGRADARARLPYHPDGGYTLDLATPFGPKEDVQMGTLGLRRPNPGVGFTREPFWSTVLHLCVLPPRSIEEGLPPPRLEVLRTLVEEFGADVNCVDSEGNTPAFWIPKQRTGHEAALALMLSLGLDVNKRARDGATALMVFCAQRELIWDDPPGGAAAASLPRAPGAHALAACVRRLLAAGARAGGLFDGFGQSALALAAKRGSVEVVRQLLQAGSAPPNERDPRTGKTALHACCPPATTSDGFSLSGVAQVLLDAGLDPRAKEKGGGTLVHACALRGDLATLRLLVERGAGEDANVLDDEGQTPLLVACAGHANFVPADARQFMEQLVRFTSPEARRARRRADGRSAVDLLSRGRWSPEALGGKRWYRRLLLGLVASGVPYEEDVEELLGLLRQAEDEEDDEDE
jgi:ankyrin repeat protein